MESQNYCNIQLPVYIDFKPVLDYVQKTIGNKELNAILKSQNKMPSEIEGVNYNGLVYDKN